MIDSYKKVIDRIVVSEELENNTINKLKGIEAKNSIRKQLIAIALVLILISGTVLAINFKGNKNRSAGTRVRNLKASASSIKINSAAELKAGSDLIVEVHGTSEFTERDYKGMPTIISVVLIDTVIKGDKSLSKINILLTKGLDKKVEAGDRLLMFLKKGIDNKDCYIPVGGSQQGIYRIKKDSNTGKFVLGEYDESNANMDLLKELSGDYETLKSQLLR